MMAYLPEVKVDHKLESMVFQSPALSLYFSVSLEESLAALNDKYKYDTAISAPPRSWTPKSGSPLPVSFGPNRSDLTLTGKDETSDCPDGGLEAWLVVLGVICAVAATFGFVNTWGVFQAYYEQLTLKNETTSNIAWIGSLQYALMFMPGLIFGRLFDMGYLHLPLSLASVLLVVSTFITAQCTKYWQFLLVQGFLVGVSSGVILTVSFGILPHWFEKKIGLAMGCAALGSSVGGIVFPIVLKNLIEHTSFQWTVYVMAFIIMGLLLVPNLTFKRRLPPKSNLGPFLDMSVLKDPVYTLYVFALMVGFLGIYTCLTYISLSGLMNNIDINFAFYLLPIANGSSIIGRIGGGALADRLGPLNILIPSTLAAGVMTYSWPFATTRGALAAVAVIYGATSGVLLALMAQPVKEMTKDKREIGMRFGIATTIMSFGALAGPPISGAILDRTGSFKPVGYYAGSTVVASVVLMTVVRQLKLGKLFGRA